MRFAVPTSRLIIVASAFVAACGGGESIEPPTQTPAIAVSLSASAVEVTQGASSTVTVTATRSGGFDGAITVAVEGAPTGVTVAQTTIAAGQSSATLTVAAAAAAAAGNSTLTVRATAPGVTAATASLALSVKAATVTPTGSFALSATPTSTSIAQGATGTVTVNVTRAGGFTGAVALTVSGAPTGLTATLNPTSVTGTSATLTLAAAQSLAAGSQTLTIRGTGSGVADQTVTVPVTITASTGGGTGNVTWAFCGLSGLPLFVAAQDGTGAWTRVTGTNNRYTFQISSGRGGISFVVATANGGFTTETFFGTTAELQTRGGEICFGSSDAGKTITAPIVGAGATDLLLTSLGYSVGTQASGNASTTFAGVLPGTLDLIAGRSALTFSGTSATFNLNRMVIRRGVNAAAGAIAAIDFNGSESFAPVARNVTVNNLNGELGMVLGSYVTANTSFGSYLLDVGATGSARTYMGVPSDRQAAGDFHALTVNALPSLTNTTTTRAATIVFRDATDKQVTLGPTPTAPAVTVVGTAPVARLRAAITIQTEYNRYFTADFQQTGSTPRRAYVQMTAGYVSGATATLESPDLSALTGFEATWGLRAGTAVTWTTTVSGWSGTGGIVSTPWVEGATYLAGTRQGTVTP